LVKHLSEIGYCVLRPAAEHVILRDTLEITEPGGI